MARCFLALGLIAILSSLMACLPHVYLLPLESSKEKDSAQQIQPSLFTPDEIDRLLGSGHSADQKSTALLSQAFKEGYPPPTVTLPISEECNDDFNLEVLPANNGHNGRDFDIPIVINAKVEQFIQYFQTTLRDRFARWLSRSARYIPIMRDLLRANGLPEDLVYLALIESGFNPFAYSRSKASGPWQFIYLTGKKYGLKVNWWVDERRDPEKSTIAAAQYLKDLYDMFECWYLAAAGYNAGEAKIAKAMKRYRTEDFWELIKYPYLKNETKNYVPQMIAAALIAKDPERYGFTDIEYQEPLIYEKIKVPAATNLSIIAKACEISLEELKDLNPELLRGFTPPDDPEYEIKIPYGKKELFLANFEKLQSSQKTKFKVHVVRKGDTLVRIARMYRVDVAPILEINHMKKIRTLPAGMNLLIPISASDGNEIHAIQATKRKESSASATEEITYVIRKGDTLWSIANEMGVNIGALSRWNNLHPDRKLFPGDKLRIKLNKGQASYERESSPREIIHLVKQGDTLWDIARTYNVSISDIKTWNNLKGDVIRPSDRLKLKIAGTKSSIPD